MLLIGWANDELIAMVSRTNSMEILVDFIIISIFESPPLTALISLAIVLYSTGDIFTL